MGKSYNACDYSWAVQLQLLCFRSSNAVSSMFDYLTQEEQEMEGRRDPSWEIIAHCCVSLKKWRVWAYYEINPLTTSSEAWLEAQHLFLFNEKMLHTGFGENFNCFEHAVLHPLLNVVEEICELYGFGEGKKERL